MVKDGWTTNRNNFKPTYTEEAMKSFRKERWKSILPAVKEYLYFVSQTSSMHGLAHVTAKGIHPAERLMWLLVLLACISGAIWVPMTAYQLSQRRPTVLSMERDYTSWNTSFPAVTLCPEVHVDPVELQVISSRLFSRLENVSATKIVFFLNTLADSTISNLPSFPLVDLPGIEPEEFLQIVLDLAPSWTYTMKGPDEDEGGDEETRGVKMDPVITERGLCYSYNSALAPFLSPRQVESNLLCTLRNPVIQGATKGSCYSDSLATNVNTLYTISVLPEKLTLCAYVIFGKQSGGAWQSDGAVTVFESPSTEPDWLPMTNYLTNTHKLSSVREPPKCTENFTWTEEDRDHILSTPVARISPLDGRVLGQVMKVAFGFTVFLHGPFEIADVSSAGIAVEAGHIKTLGLSGLEVFTTANAAQLTPTQRNCRLPSEGPPGTTPPIYSFALCRRRCRARLAKTLCGCVPHWDTFLKEGQICNLKGLRCLSNYQDALVRIRNPETNEPVECDCFPACDYVSYVVENQEVTPWFLGAGLEYGLSKYPRARLKRDVFFTPKDVLVSFGSAAGLFLGCSFLSFIEFVYFFTLGLYWYIRKQKDAKIGMAKKDDNVMKDDKEGDNLHKFNYDRKRFMSDDGAWRRHLLDSGGSHTELLAWVE